MKRILVFLLLITVLISSLTFTAFAADEIVITTSDALCKREGSGWAESTNEKVAGPDGGTSWYTSNKSASAVFDASKLEKGNYGVYVYATPWGTTASLVDVTITASGKSTTVTIDGMDGGAGNRHWVFVGKYDFDGSSADSVVQKINAASSEGAVRVSGAKFVKNDTTTADIPSAGVTGEIAAPTDVEYTTVPESGSVVIGTQHAGFSKKGSWKQSGLIMPADGKGFYSSVRGDSAVWYPYINKAANVEVSYLKASATEKEDAALQIEIYAGGEITTLSVDCTLQPTDWYSLGRYDFSGDGSEYIKITKTSTSGISRITCLKFAINDEASAPEAKSAFFGTDLHILERMGMLIGEGDGITEEYINTVPTRVQAAIMVLRLNGVDADAAAFTGQDNFADASLEPWAMPYLAYLKAHPEFGLEGTGSNMFEPKAQIDAQAYAKILLKALGYNINDDFTWDETLAFAKEKGIASSTSGGFNVNDLAVMTVSALNLSCKSGTPLLEKLISERDGVKDEGVYGTELTDELKAAREEAKNKKRGIIYNNDGNDVYTPYDNYPGPFDTSKLDGATINTENFLKTRSYGLENTQVGSVFYCTGVFNSYTHESTGITDTRVRDWSYRLKEFTGKDSLETMVDYVHSLGKEIFWSMRMNDTHDYQYEENQLDPWKQAHLDLLMYRKNGGSFMQYGGTRWSSVDYTYDEVRQLVYDILKDTLTRYDIDGLELDMTRWPIFFKEITQGYDIYPENIERMNNLIRMIRDLTEKVSMERGKPILLALYIPDSLEFCRDIGIDVRQWLKEGLVDIVSISCHSGKFQSWEDGIAEFADYDVQVYAALDPLAYNNNADQYTVDKNEAALAYAAGADGVYTYNYFDINHERFDILGSADTCGAADPSYATQMLPYTATFIKNGSKYVTFKK